MGVVFSFPAASALPYVTSDAKLTPSAGLASLTLIPFALAQGSRRRRLRVPFTQERRTNQGRTR
jgi:hypothetical protein